MGGQGWVYLQPNNFDSKKGTHGLLENGYTYELNHLKRNWKLEAPSDWTISIMYNIGLYAGEIKLSSIV